MGLRLLLINGFGSEENDPENRSNGGDYHGNLHGMDAWVQEFLGDGHFFVAVGLQIVADLQIHDQNNANANKGYGGQ
jgi:hypothetical protein